MHHFKNLGCHGLSANGLVPYLLLFRKLAGYFVGVLIARLQLLNGILVDHVKNIHLVQVVLSFLIEYVDWVEVLVLCIKVL